MDLLYFVLDHSVHMLVLVILALSLNLINGFTGMFSLGHHGFFAVGAYASGALLLFAVPEASSDAVGGALGAGWFVTSLIVGTAAAALFGLVVGLPCLRLKGDYLAIVTLGFAEIVRIMVQNTDAIGAARGLEVAYLLLPRNLDTQMTYVVMYVALVGLLTAGTFLVIRNLLRSTHGRALIAIREDEIAAELLGVNLAYYKVLAFVLGSGLAGMAGALYLNYTTQIEPKEFNFLKGIYILLYVVLGGMGSLSGTVVATAILYALDKMVLNLMPPSIQSWREVMFALLLILIMILRPQGIFGHKEINQTAAWQRIFGRKQPEGAALK